MLSITATENWHNAFHGSIIGLLELSGVDITHSLTGLEKQKRKSELHLRERYRDFTRQDFLALPIMSAYQKYYKRFNKTYHVQLQVESIVLKDKNLPVVSPLVDANFIAEVETFVLTAGHDVNKLEGDVSIDVSKEGDIMTLMNGTSKIIYPGDMVMKDAGNIICSIIYGQDNRSLISNDTSHVLYVVYAPEGVPEELVEKQLQKNCRQCPVILTGCHYRTTCIAQVKKNLEALFVKSLTA
jgi:DNA/RNA-binding domain of Phe-tRNA-synthetase-like protein